MLPISTFMARGLNKLRLLSWLNASSTIRVNNKKITIPLLKKLGYHNLWLTEPWMTQLLVQLKPLFNGHFVDIGVNLGQTLIKAQSVYDNVHYTGFEPNSTCVHYSEELVRINRFRNCHIIPVGINKQSEILKLNFFYSDDTDPSASIIEQFRPDQQIDHYKYVPVFDYGSVRDFLPTARHALLKIDVEGAELEVIKGLAPWLEATRPIILMEILPVYKKENQFRLGRQEEMQSLLHSMDYQIARIRKTEPVGITVLPEIGIHDNINNSDYVIYPAELQKAIKECLPD